MQIESLSHLSTSIPGELHLGATAADCHACKAFAESKALLKRAAVAELMALVEIRLRVLA